MNFYELISMFVFIMTFGAKVVSTMYFTRKDNVYTVTPVILKSYKNQKLSSKFYKHVSINNFLGALTSRTFKYKLESTLSVATEILDDS
ncbi:hypothetical protein [Clostridium ihumii]|uniref:hypothetical protein n=1 Tax=Clostridium ihumii TaxID=1470356 RepID=UPI003D332A7C